VNAPLARSSHNRQKMAVAGEGDERGKLAITHYEVLRSFGGRASGAEHGGAGGKKWRGGGVLGGVPGGAGDQCPKGQDWRGGGGGENEKARVSLLRCMLETGRTHQIRVHMAHMRHPLLGDAVYGSGFAASARNLPPAARLALDRLGRQALHAAELGFLHPMSGEELHFRSSPPPDMAALIKALADC
jgi:23S rRNA-/tRNA-specific pseudouridylate synthase